MIEELETLKSAQSSINEAVEKLKERRAKLWRELCDLDKVLEKYGSKAPPAKAVRTGAEVKARYEKITKVISENPGLSRVELCRVLQDMCIYKGSRNPKGHVSSDIHRMEAAGLLLYSDASGSYTVISGREE